MDESPAEIEPSATDRYQARLRWPLWLKPNSITFTLGLLGSMSYVGLYAFDWAFLDRFGTSPEEVGVTQSALIVRAALAGSVVVGFSVLLSGIILGVLAAMAGLARAVYKKSESARELNEELSQWRASRNKGTSVGEHAWSLTPVGSIKRRTIALSVACASVVTIVGKYTNPDNIYGPWNDVSGAIFLGAFLSLCFGIAAHFRHAAAVAFAALVLYGTVTYWSTQSGDAVAVKVQSTDGLASRVVGSGKVVGQFYEAGALGDPSTEWLFRITGLEARVVCLDWVSGVEPPLLAEGAIYLGHANGVSLLSDGQRLFRVRDSQIRAVITPNPYTATSINCPPVN